MSYHLTSGEAVATANHNGRGRAMTGHKCVEHSGEVQLAWAAIELAVDDLKILCRYGIVTVEGELKAWPRLANGSCRTIAGMHGPLDHAFLREFFLEPSQGQVWADYAGCNLPPAEIYATVCRKHGAKK
jgi:hypothetical protein